MKPNKRTKLSLASFQVMFSTDDKCRAYLEHTIWKNTPTCRHCQSTNVGKVVGKSARAGLHQCHQPKCGKQFTVTVGTIFQDTHLPLTKWFMAIYLLTETSKGVSANWLKDAIGTTYKTAWYLGHRIRRMMDAGDAMLTGIVEIDETYVGGKPRKGSDKPVKRGRGTNKAPVFVAVQRGGEVRATTMDNLKFQTMKPHLQKWISGDATLMTDEFSPYNKLGSIWKYHFTVQHGAGEYANGDVHINTAESFNSTLKRAYIGVYHYMSPKHLLRYVSESVYRWNKRSLTTLDRLADVLGCGVSRPLPYRVLVGSR